MFQCILVLLSSYDKPCLVSLTSNFNIPLVSSFLWPICLKTSLRDQFHPIKAYRPQILRREKRWKSLPLEPQIEANLLPSIAILLVFWIMKISALNFWEELLLRYFSLGSPCPWHSKKLSSLISCLKSPAPLPRLQLCWFHCLSWFCDGIFTSPIYFFEMDINHIFRQIQHNVYCFRHLFTVKTFPL